MTMHLCNVRVIEKSNTKKWKSAEHKRKAAELQESWERIKESHKVKAGSVGSKYSLKPPVGRRTTQHIPSVGDSIGIAAKKDVPEYTGENMKGIAIMHKSCLQPVFSDQEAKDSASMRR